MITQPPEPGCINIYRIIAFDCAMLDTQILSFDDAVIDISSKT